jgi:hypothetical protein
MSAGELSFREEDGWAELDDVREAVARGDLDRSLLWALCAQRDHDGAAALLEAAGWDPIVRPCKVAIVHVPCAEWGERDRVFVQEDNWDPDEPEPSAP